MDNKSFCLEGAAGTGKTYLTNIIVDALEKKGERVIVIGKTHVSCSLYPNAITCNSFVYKHIVNGSYRGTIVLDEFSLLDAQLWFFLYRLIDYCTFICVGSWEQLPPINGYTWLDNDLGEDAIENSRMFHRICGGNRIRLTECKRSDATLFDWYTSLERDGARYNIPLDDVLHEARRFFNGNATPNYTLCIDHRLRKIVNREANERLKPKDAIWLEAPKSVLPNQPQSFWLYTGQVLIAHTQSNKQMKNGMFYTVEGYDSENVFFKDSTASETQCSARSAPLLTLKKSWVVRNCRLSHCLTISSVQGRTLHGIVEILTNHPRFSRRHLLVCLSRATDASKVQVK